MTPSQIESWIKANFEYREANNGWIRICNPIQEIKTGTKDTKFHLNINIENGAVHDWRPNHQYIDGNVINFVKMYLDCSFRDAVKAIKSAKVADISMIKDEDDEYEPPSQEITHLELPESWVIGGDGPKQLEKLALNYLNNRKISKEEALMWGIRYGVDMIVFPYIEYDEVVYWQSRSLMNKRFEFPGKEVGVGKSQFLYGWHMAEPNDTIFVTEAIFDAVSIGAGALASGGAGLSAYQIEKLEVMRPNPLILCPDNDEAGWTSLVSNYENMKQYHGNIWYCLPPDPIKDWNDLAKTGKNPREYINKNMAKMDLSRLIRIKKKIKTNKNSEFRKRILDE